MRSLLFSHTSNFFIMAKSRFYRPIMRGISFSSARKMVTTAARSAARRVANPRRKKTIPFALLAALGVAVLLFWGKIKAMFSKS